MDVVKEITPPLDAVYGMLAPPLPARRPAMDETLIIEPPPPWAMAGTAWDIAWAAVFLASDEARWISGVVLPMDAGLLATTPLAMLEHLR